MKNLVAGTVAVLVLLAVMYLVPSKIESLVTHYAAEDNTAAWQMDTELAQDGLFDPLRGQTPVTSSNPPPPAYHYATNTGPIARNYLTQPPVIPHKIDGYDINMRSNKCLSCHSWRSYREWGATKISLTHYRDRDGRELDDVSPLRYFCTQCHVPQLDARPLVRNDFRPVASLDAR